MLGLQAVTSISVDPMSGAAAEGQGIFISRHPDYRTYGCALAVEA
jgi:hypothetical protein